MGDVIFCYHTIDVPPWDPAKLVFPTDLHELVGDTKLRMQREPRMRREPGHKQNMISYRVLVPSHHKSRVLPLHTTSGADKN